LNFPWREVLDDNTHLKELIQRREQSFGFPLQRIWNRRAEKKGQVVSACSDGLYTLVEMEWRQKGQRFDFNSKIGFLRELSACYEAEDVARVLMKYIARVTGFDRVMLYQFAPDWHGKVIAEKNRPGVQGFLGLHFPASDIPPNARRLYVKNIQRFIADTEAGTENILTHEAGQSIDLTWSQLRAVHPVHIDYLRNIKARSSFSVSIVTAGRLWGMVACHHLQVRAMSLKLRYLCEELARIASLHMSGLQAVAAEKRRNRLQLSLVHVGSAMDMEQPAESVGKQLIQVMEVVGADSMLLRLGGKSFAHGPLATSGKLGALRKWLAGHPETKRLWHCSQIPEALVHDPVLVSYASGMLFVPFGPKRQHNYVLFTRNEQMENIRWAGRLPAEIGEVPRPQTPRASFAAWEQETQGQSLSWDELEIETAGQMGRALTEDLNTAHLEKLAMQDSLTRLPNRRSFERSLSQGIRAANRHKNGLAVFMLDLDDFKPVNDEYGHEAGDELLIEIGRRLTQVVRERDTVARLGGDEFAIIQYHLGKSPTEEVVLVAERMVAELSRPVKLKQASVTVGVSVGIALYPQHGRSDSQLVKLADEAMYEVKETGKNGYRIFNEHESASR